MFDQSQMEGYYNVKAPKELYNKIKTKRKNYSWAVIAACLVCVLVLGAFLIPDKSEIKVNGVVMENNSVVLKNLPKSRSAYIPVNIELEITEETEVSVSQGYLLINSQEQKEKITLTESCQFCWMADENNIPAEINISDEKGVTKFTLIYENSQYILKKEK